MASQLYREFKIFTAELPAGVAQGSTSLLPSDQAIIVVDLSTASNDDCPLTWRIGFIGTETELNDYYIPQMAEWFEDGRNRNAGCGASDARTFKGLMTKLMKKATEITVDDFHRAGCPAYSWAESQAKAFGGSDASTFNFFGELGYAYFIKEQADIDTLLRQSFAVKATYPDETPVPLEDQLWRGRPYQFCAWDLARRIEEAEEAIC